jgi:hypothetical protein
MLRVLPGRASELQRQSRLSGGRVFRLPDATKFKSSVLQCNKCSISLAGLPYPLTWLPNNELVLGEQEQASPEGVGRSVNSAKELKFSATPLPLLLLLLGGC